MTDVSCTYHNINTARIEVPFMWGSLRLAPIRQPRDCMKRNEQQVVTSDMQAWFGASLSEVVLRMVYGNVMVMIVRMTVSVQSP